MNGAEAWEAWEDIAESREDLSPFLMPAWSRALHVRMPRFTPCPRPLEIEGRPAVLPLMSSPWHAGLRVLESGPWATYGGIISNEAISIEAAADFYESLPTLLAPTLRITTPPGIEDIPRAHHITRKQTRIVDLQPGYDAIHAHAFTRQMRAGIRRAQERGVQISIASTEDGDRAFLGLYEKSKARWGDGVTGFPSAFLQGWSREPEDFARLWLAWLDGKAASAALVLYGKGQLQYLAGAGDSESFHARPNNLLFSTIIADACGKGYRSLNLGSSSGIEGVERFKEQMGGKIANYVTATFEHPWLRGVRKLRSAK